MVQPFKKDKMHAIAARGIAAFSLVELAVVLAILGLLAGGVMATTSYLNNARQTTVINEGKLYLNAFKQFEQKYGGALPGDMANATDYWSGALNGNGNSILCFDTNYSECFAVFKHLQLAGLITGNYTGVAGPAGSLNALLGVNVPAFSMDGVGAYFLTNGMVGPADLNYFEGNYGTTLYLGKRKNNNLMDRPFLTPGQAMELDSKYDDGRSSTGWIRHYKSATCNDTTTGEYLASSTTAETCQLLLLPK